MPRRRPTDPSEPCERAATTGDAYIMDCAAKVHRACHKFLMERDPKYAEDFRRNSTRLQTVADRKKS
jgi:hypothetical protein